MEISNQITGAELKEMFRKKAKFEEGKYTFRIFFSGSEIKDDQVIGQHKIQNGFKLQVMKFNKIGSDTKSNSKSGNDEEEKKKKKKHKHRHKDKGSEGDE
ncbi:MAG: ubiquitin family protein [archaeon]|nr:ubiquitin family protein [archaeon]